MIRTVALLGLVACASVSAWESGLSVRYDITLVGNGTTAFIELPQSVASAIAMAWEQTTKPDNLPEGYDLLSIFCPKDDYTVCGFFDDTGFIAGLQVALDKAKFSGNIFDWDVQGFTNWTIDNNGTILNFWTTQQYYISPETLATDPATRVATRNPDLLLQDDCILVSGFNGELYRIPTNVSDITGPNSDFTVQACIPWMGEHHYYNMTADLECKADTLFPWFPLVNSEQVIGVGLAMYGKYIVNDGDKNWFEIPPRSFVQTTVPRGPECVYDLADSPGMVTMHTYIIKHPYQVACD